jgi:hypothetical protein
VLDTCLTHQEVHDAAVLAWYLDTFNSPLLAINIFTTLHRRNNHFKDDDFLSFFLRCCNVFDTKIVVKVFLMQRRLYIPRTFINPELRLNLNDLNEADCKSYFRFSHSEIKRIIVHLQLPEVIIVPTHADRVLIVEAICLIFRRLSYPCRWFDLQNQFGRHVSALSRIFYYTMHLILQRVKHGVLFFNISMENLQSFVDVFASHGVPEVIKLFAVIDVKKHNICKPTRHQRSMYSGHKRVHCVKYQTLEAPNGLILHCSIGDDGRRGDGYVLRHSRLIPFLQNHPILHLFQVLGDSAYPNCDVMVSIYKGRHLPPASAAFNSIMIPIRTSVEWGYEKIVRYWAFLDYKKAMKIQLSAILPMWHLAIFLTNCLTCAKGGNQISKFFNIEPPSLEEYLLNVTS